MIKRILIFSWISIAGLILFDEILFAHSFSERYSSPIDISFVILFIFCQTGFLLVLMKIIFPSNDRLLRYPRYNILQLSIARKLFAKNILANFLKSISIVTLVLLIWACFFGTKNPVDNLSTTFIWVIWWTGIGLFSAFVGNIWSLINPWKTIYEWAEILLGRKKSQRNDGIWCYPQILDVWPAVISILILAWVENVFTGSTKPVFLGFAILIYSVVTWAGMIAVGKNIWLKNFDPFSITFELLSCFAIVELRENTKTFKYAPSHEPKERKAIFLRPLSLGLMNLSRPSYAKMVFIIAFSSNVIFAGILETPLWLAIKSDWIGIIQTITGVSIYSSVPGYFIDFLGILLFWRVLFALYSGVIHLMRYLSGTKIDSLELKQRLIWIIIPITILFSFAHEFAFFLIDAQMIIPLISDPFGFGWDVFRTADYTRNILIIDAKGAFLILVVSTAIGGFCSALVANVITNQIFDAGTSLFLVKLPLFIFLGAFSALSVLLISQPMLL